MKPFRLLLLLKLCLAVLHAQSPRPEPEYVFPATPFDAEATRLALEPGPATLRGVASTKSNTIGKGEGFLRSLTKSYPARKGATIALFPRTAYFDEWHALRKKHAKGPKLAVMSPLAYSHRIVAKVTDDQGNFEFRGLKPGRYYLEASIVFTQELSEKVQTGTELVAVDGNIYINPVFTRQYYHRSDRGFVETFIEIPAGREIVDVKLK
jgi:hypothetical protein